MSPGHGGTPRRHPARLGWVPGTRSTRTHHLPSPQSKGAAPGCMQSCSCTQTGMGVYRQLKAALIFAIFKQNCSHRDCREKGRQQPQDSPVLSNPTRQGAGHNPVCCDELEEDDSFVNILQRAEKLL